MEQRKNLPMKLKKSKRRVIYDSSSSENEFESTNDDDNLASKSTIDDDDDDDNLSSESTIDDDANLASTSKSTNDGDDDDDNNSDSDDIGSTNGDDSDSIYDTFLRNIKWSMLFNVCIAIDLLEKSNKTNSDDQKRQILSVLDTFEGHLVYFICDYLSTKELPLTSKKRRVDVNNPLAVLFQWVKSRMSIVKKAIDDDISSYFDNNIMDYHDGLINGSARIYNSNSPRRDIDNLKFKGFLNSKFQNNVNGFLESDDELLKALVDTLQGPGWVELWSLSMFNKFKTLVNLKDSDLDEAKRFVKEATQLYESLPDLIKNEILSKALYKPFCEMIGVEQIKKVTKKKGSSHPQKEPTLRPLSTLKNSWNTIVNSYMNTTKSNNAPTKELQSRLKILAKYIHAQDHNVKTSLLNSLKVPFLGKVPKTIIQPAQSSSTSSSSSNQEENIPMVDKENTMIADDVSMVDEEDTNAIVGTGVRASNSKSTAESNALVTDVLTPLVLELDECFIKLRNDVKSTLDVLEFDLKSKFPQGVEMDAESVQRDLSEDEKCTYYCLRLYMDQQSLNPFISRINTQVYDFSKSDILPKNEWSKNDKELFQNLSNNLERCLQFATESYNIGIECVDQISKIQLKLEIHNNTTFDINFIRASCNTSREYLFLNDPANERSLQSQVQFLNSKELPTKTERIPKNAIRNKRIRMNEKGDHGIDKANVYLKLLIHYQDVARNLIGDDTNEDGFIHQGMVVESREDLEKLSNDVDSTTQKLENSFLQLVDGENTITPGDVLTSQDSKKARDVVFTFVKSCLEQDSFPRYALNADTLVYATEDRQGHADRIGPGHVLNLENYKRIKNWGLIWNYMKDIVILLLDRIESAKAREDLYRWELKSACELVIGLNLPFLRNNQVNLRTLHNVTISQMILFLRNVIEQTYRLDFTESNAKVFTMLDNTLKPIPEIRHTSSLSAEDWDEESGEEPRSSGLLESFGSNDDDDNQSAAYKDGEQVVSIEQLMRRVENKLEHVRTLVHLDHHENNTRAFLSHVVSKLRLVSASDLNILFNDKGDDEDSEWNAQQYVEFFEAWFDSNSENVALGVIYKTHLSKLLRSFSGLWFTDLLSKNGTRGLDDDELIHFFLNHKHMFFQRVTGTEKQLRDTVDQLKQKIDLYFDKQSSPEEAKAFEKEKADEEDEKEDQDQDEKEGESDKEDDDKTECDSPQTCNAKAESSPFSFDDTVNELKSYITLKMNSSITDTASFTRVCKNFILSAAKLLGEHGDITENIEELDDVELLAKLMYATSEALVTLSRRPTLYELCYRELFAFFESRIPEYNISTFVENTDGLGSELDIYNHRIIKYLRNIQTGQAFIIEQFIQVIEKLDHELSSRNISHTHASLHKTLHDSLKTTSNNPGDHKRKHDEIVDAFKDNALIRQKFMKVEDMLGKLESKMGTKSEKSKWCEVGLTLMAQFYINRVGNQYDNRFGDSNNPQVTMENAQDVIDKFFHVIRAEMSFYKTQLAERYAVWYQKWLPHMNETVESIFASLVDIPIVANNQQITRNDKHLGNFMKCFQDTLKNNGTVINYIVDRFDTLKATIGTIKQASSEISTTSKNTEENLNSVSDSARIVKDHLLGFERFYDIIIEKSHTCGITFPDDWKLSVENPPQVNGERLAKYPTIRNIYFEYYNQIHSLFKGMFGQYHMNDTQNKFVNLGDGVQNEFDVAKIDSNIVHNLDVIVNSRASLLDDLDTFLDSVWLILLEKFPDIASEFIDVKEMETDLKEMETNANLSGNPHELVKRIAQPYAHISTSPGLKQSNLSNVPKVTRQKLDKILLASKKLSPKVKTTAPEIEQLEDDGVITDNYDDNDPKVRRIEKTCHEIEKVANQLRKCVIQDVLAFERIAQIYGYEELEVFDNLTYEVGRLQELIEHDERFQDNNELCVFADTHRQLILDLVETEMSKSHGVQTNNNDHVPLPQGQGIHTIFDDDNDLDFDFDQEGKNDDLDFDFDQEGNNDDDLDFDQEGNNGQLVGRNREIQPRFGNHQMEFEDDGNNAIGQFQGDLDTGSSNTMFGQGNDFVDDPDHQASSGDKETGLQLYWNELQQSLLDINNRTVPGQMEDLTYGEKTRAYLLENWHYNNDVQTYVQYLEQLAYPCVSFEEDKDLNEAYETMLEDIQKLCDLMSPPMHEHVNKWFVGDTENVVLTPHKVKNLMLGCQVMCSLARSFNLDENGMVDFKYFKRLRDQSDPNANIAYNESIHLMEQNEAVGAWSGLILEIQSFFESRKNNVVDLAMSDSYVGSTYTSNPNASIRKTKAGIKQTSWKAQVFNVEDLANSVRANQARNGHSSPDPQGNCQQELQKLNNDYSEVVRQRQNFMVGLEECGNKLIVKDAEIADLNTRLGESQSSFRTAQNAFGRLQELLFIIYPGTDRNGYNTQKVQDLDRFLRGKLKINISGGDITRANANTFKLIADNIDTLFRNPGIVNIAHKDHLIEKCKVFTLAMLFADSVMSGSLSVNHAGAEGITQTAQFKAQIEDLQAHVASLQGSVAHAENVVQRKNQEIEKLKLEGQHALNTQLESNRAECVDKLNIVKEEQKQLFDQSINILEEENKRLRNQLSQGSTQHASNSMDDQNEKLKAAYKTLQVQYKQLHATKEASDTREKLFTEKFLELSKRMTMAKICDTITGFIKFFDTSEITTLNTIRNQLSGFHLSDTQKTLLYVTRCVQEMSEIEKVNQTMMNMQNGADYVKVDCIQKQILPSLMSRIKSQDFLDQKNPELSIFGRTLRIVDFFAKSVLQPVVSHGLVVRKKVTGARGLNEQSQSNFKTPAPASFSANPSFGNSVWGGFGTSTQKSFGGPPPVDGSVGTLKKELLTGGVENGIGTFQKDSYCPGKGNYSNVNLFDAAPGQPKWQNATEDGSFDALRPQYEWLTWALEMMFAWDVTSKSGRIFMDACDLVERYYEYPAFTPLTETGDKTLNIFQMRLECTFTLNKRKLYFFSQRIRNDYANASKIVEILTVNENLKYILGACVGDILNASNSMTYRVVRRKLSEMNVNDSSRNEALSDTTSKKTGDNRKMGNATTPLSSIITCLLQMLDNRARDSRISSGDSIFFQTLYNEVLTVRKPEPLVTLAKVSSTKRLQSSSLSTTTSTVLLSSNSKLKCSAQNSNDNSTQYGKALSIETIPISTKEILYFSRICDLKKNQTKVPLSPNLVDRAFHENLQDSSSQSVILKAAQYGDALAIQKLQTFVKETGHPYGARPFVLK